MSQSSFSNFAQICIWVLIKPWICSEACCGSSEWTVYSLHTQKAALVSTAVFTATRCLWFERSKAWRFVPVHVLIHMTFLKETLEGSKNKQQKPVWIWWTLIVMLFISKSQKLFMDPKLGQKKTIMSFSVSSQKVHSRKLDFVTQGCLSILSFHFSSFDLIFPCNYHPRKLAWKVTNGKKSNTLDEVIL